VSADSNFVTETVLAYDFAVALSTPPVKLRSGERSTLNIIVTPVGGFNGTVKLACTGLPEHSQCVMSHGGTVSLASGPQTVQLTINCSDIYKFGSEARNERPLAIRSVPFLLATLACNGAVAITAPLAVNVTIPVGCPKADDTVEARVKGLNAATGFGVTVSVVLLGSPLTTCVSKPTPLSKYLCPSAG